MRPCCRFESGADVNAKDQEGWTALKWAVTLSKWEAVRVLLENGARMDDPLEVNQTALTDAAKNNHLADVRALLNKGARINEKTAQDHSALIKAILEDKAPEVTRLLEREVPKREVPKSEAQTDVKDNPDVESDEQPLQPTDISFGLPIYATQEDYEPKHPTGMSLADSYEPGRPVVLVSREGICTAVTSSKFQYGTPGGADFEATHLKVRKKCSGFIAVIGVSPEAVRFIRPSEDKSPLPKDVELEARRKVKLPKELEENYPMSDAAAQIIRVGEIVLVLFGRHTGSMKEASFFSAALIMNNEVYPLEGPCTHTHNFLSVNDKLHLTYRSQCCGCGALDILVYDLSSGTPKKVYDNGLLGD
jgi:hypothetical protein